MTPRLFLLFNHRLTAQQILDAKRSLEVSEFHYPPGDLQGRWSRIPAEEPAIESFLSPFKEWLNGSACTGDFLLIQGDFGATYLMVQFAMQRRFIPIYSTTKRYAQEETLPDGSIRLVHHFTHMRFRRYGE